MPYVEIVHSDEGRYHVSQISEDEAHTRHAAGEPVASVQPRVLEAWDAHLAADVAWQSYWGVLENNYAESLERDRQWLVIFRVLGLPGEASRGPFPLELAAKERALVIATVDPQAYLRNVGSLKEVR